MRRKALRFFAAALAVGITCDISSAAHGALLSFQANLDGLQVVPPNGSPAFGLGDFTLDDTSGVVSVLTGTYQDLLGGATSVSFNGMATPGNNAPSLFALTLDTPGAMTGTFSGGGTLTNIMQINGMKAGNTYVIIRSSVFPSGEIRGQVLEVPEPGSAVLLLSGLIGIAALSARRRRSFR